MSYESDYRDAIIARKNALEDAAAAKFRAMDAAAAMQSRAAEVACQPDILAGKNEAERKNLLTRTLDTDTRTNQLANELRQWDTKRVAAETAAEIAREYCRLYRLLMAQEIGVTIGDL